jgi:hypothetical protein
MGFATTFNQKLFREYKKRSVKVEENKRSLLFDISMVNTSIITLAFVLDYKFFLFELDEGFMEFLFYLLVGLQFVLVAVIVLRRLGVRL